MIKEYEISIYGNGPYGIRIKGGREFRTPIVVTQVTPESKADLAGIKPNMEILSVNEKDFANITHTEAVSIIKNSPSLNLKLIENSSYKSDLPKNYSFDTSQNGHNKVNGKCFNRGYTKAWYRDFIQQMDIKSRNGFRNKSEEEDKNDEAVSDLILNNLNASLEALSKIQESEKIPTSADLIDKTNENIKMSENKDDFSFEESEKSKDSVNMDHDYLMKLKTQEIIQKYLSPLNTSIKNKLNSLNNSLNSLEEKNKEIDHDEEPKKPTIDKNIQFHSDEEYFHQNKDYQHSLPVEKISEEKKLDDSEFIAIPNNSPMSNFSEIKKLNSLRRLQTQFKNFIKKNKKNGGTKENGSTYDDTDKQENVQQDKNISKKLKEPTKPKKIKKESLINPNDGLFHPCIVNIIRGYKPVSPAELTLDKNECLHLLRKIDDKWYEAELKGVIGKIETSNLSILNAGKIMSDFDECFALGTSITDHKTLSKIYHSYKIGDYMVVNSIIDDKYYEVTYNNIRGIIDRHEVQLFRPIYRLIYNSFDDKKEKINRMKANTCSDHENDVMFVCQAYQNYKPLAKDEIEVETDDLIYVKRFYSDGWGFGYNERTSSCGMFPVFFCDLIIPIE